MLLVSAKRTDYVQSNNDYLCCKCRLLLVEPVVLPCYHEICLPCIDQIIRTDEPINCPECRKRFGSWMRMARKSNQLINQDLWSVIKEKFGDRRTVKSKQTELVVPTKLIQVKSKVDPLKEVTIQDNQPGETKNVTEFWQQAYIDSVKERERMYFKPIDPVPYTNTPKENNVGYVPPLRFNSDPTSINNFKPAKSKINLLLTARIRRSAFVMIPLRDALGEIIVTERPTHREFIDYVKQLNAVEISAPPPLKTTTRKAITRSMGTVERAAVTNVTNVYNVISSSSIATSSAIVSSSAVVNPRINGEQKLICNIVLGEENRRLIEQKLLKEKQQKPGRLKVAVATNEPIIEPKKIESKSYFLRSKQNVGKSAAATNGTGDIDIEQTDCSGHLKVPRVPKIVRKTLATYRYGKIGTAIQKAKTTTKKLVRKKK